MIRWLRLERKWFQSLFLQKDMISFERILIDLLRGKLPRVIDGESTNRGFLFHGFHGVIPNDDNSYLFFKLAEMELYDDMHRQYNDNPFSISCWDEYCTNHPLNIDTDENIEMAKKYQVSGLPTLLVFKDGEVVERMVGLMPKSTIITNIEKHL